MRARARTRAFFFIRKETKQNKNSCRASAYLLAFAILTSVSAFFLLFLFLFLSSFNQFTVRARARVCLYLFSLNSWQLTDLFIGYIRATHTHTIVHARETIQPATYIQKRRSTDGKRERERTSEPKTSAAVHAAIEIRAERCVKNLMVAEY